MTTKSKDAVMAFRASKAERKKLQTKATEAGLTVASMIRLYLKKAKLI